MKVMSMLLIAVLAVVCNLRAEQIVSGSVVISDVIGAIEFSQEYELSGAESPQALVWSLAEKRKNGGRKMRSLAANAKVEVQRLSDMKTIATGKTDGCGKFSVRVPDGTSYCRVISSIVLNIDGKDDIFKGAHSMEKPKIGIEVELCRESVSLCGRCLDKSGHAVTGIIISAKQFIHSEGLQHIPAEYGVSDANGVWMIDGLRAPGIFNAAEYIGNTSIAGNSARAENAPLESRLSYMSPDSSKCFVEKTIPMIPDGLRRAAEKFRQTYDKRNRRHSEMKRPLEFPVSTNDVIYVPDVVL